MTLETGQLPTATLTKTVCTFTRDFMTSRITNLAKQAGLIAPYGSDREGLADFDYRKFAELILKDVNNLLRDNWRLVNDHPDVDTPRSRAMYLGMKTAYTNALDEIQQHFKD